MRKTRISTRGLINHFRKVLINQVVSKLEKFPELQILLAGRDLS
jgi:hypothetical protein